MLGSAERLRFTKESAERRVNVLDYQDISLEFITQQKPKLQA